MLELAVEPYSAIAVEIEPMLLLNKQEARMPEREFRPAVESLLAMEVANCLVVVTARLNSMLVGYMAWGLFQQLDSADTFVATHLAWFVPDEFRKMGIGLMLARKSKEVLHDGLGLGLRLHSRHPAGGKDLTPIFKMLGARKAEEMWEL